MPLGILCKRATLQTPYHAFPVSPGLNDDGAINAVEDKNSTMSSSHLKATSHVGDSAVKARPKRETRDVELYTRTAVWEEDIIVEIIFGMSLPGHGGDVYPPGHQRPEQHGDEEAEGVAGHDEGAGGGNVDCLRGHWSPTWWCRAGRGGRSPRQRWELRPSCCPRCVQWQTFFQDYISKCFMFGSLRENLPIRRNIVDGAKPIKRRPGGGFSYFQ